MPKHNFYCPRAVKINDLGSDQDLLLPTDLFLPFRSEAFCQYLLGNSWDTKIKMDFTFC